MLLRDRGGSWRRLLQRAGLMLCRHWRWETASNIFALGHWRWVVNTSRSSCSSCASTTKRICVVAGQLPLATRLARLLLAIAAEWRHAGRVEKGPLWTSHSLFLPPLDRAAALLFWQSVSRHRPPQYICVAWMLHVRREYGVRSNKLPGYSQIKVGGMAALGLAYSFHLDLLTR
jgi:hypothetical protein